MNRVYIVILLIMTAITMALCHTSNKLAEAKEKLRVSENNVTALTTDISYYETANDKNVAVVKGLEMSLESAKMTYKSLMSTVESMRLKDKNLSSVQNIVGELTYVNNDTLRLKRTSDSAKTIYIDDPNLQATLTINDDSLILKGNAMIRAPTDMVVAVETQYKRRWFLGRKRITGRDVHVTCSNPYIKITSVSYIEIK